VNAALLIVEAAGAGVDLRLDGDRLRWKASAPPPDDLLARLKAHKLDIIAHLTAEAATPITTPTEPRPASDHADGEPLVHDAAAPADPCPNLRPSDIRAKLDYFGEAMARDGASAWHVRQRAELERLLAAKLAFLAGRSSAIDSRLLKPFTDSEGVSPGSAASRETHRGPGTVERALADQRSAMRMDREALR
jgi:hypothetical protein